MLKKLIYIFLCIFLCTESMASEASKVSLSVYKEKEEWNFVNTRLYLKNVSDLPIQNPVVTYFAQYDPNLSAAVDYSAWPLQATIRTVPSGMYTKVDVVINGLLMPGKTQQVDIRIFHNNWNALDTKNDWSYQENLRTMEPAYSWAVRDAEENLLWGSDPVADESKSDVVFWQNGDGMQVVKKYNGENESVSGRFWLVKDSVLSVREREILAEIGVSSHAGFVYMDKFVYQVTSNSAISKQVLDDSLFAFYNAFPVTSGDVAKLIVSDEDNYETVQVCDAAGTCENQVSVRDSFDLVTTCWNDVSQAQCVQMVASCGAIIATADGKDVYARIHRDGIACIESNAMTSAMRLPEKEQPTNEFARQSVGLDQVQYGFNYDLSSGYVSTSWLNGSRFTGEGIVIGIYDTGIDFTHPFFREYADANDMVGVSREASDAELHFDSDVKKNASLSVKNKGKGGHGTHVAGIAAGNGNGTSNLVYRGMAPKAHLLSFHTYFDYQVGNVTNHSHVMEDDATYDGDAKMIDEHIFYNWKDLPNGDTVTKAFVLAAGNNGFGAQYGHQQGYHSVLGSSKNAITVGMLTGMNGKRHTNSSMGPTWDGRIKPDIMAPGGDIVSTFSATEPFVAQIDYIKVSRNGQEVFYEDFSNFATTGEIVPAGGNAVEPQVIGGSPSVLQVKQTNESSGDAYLLTRLKPGKTFVVENGDDVELRVRYVGSRPLPRNFVGSTIYFGYSETEDFYKDEKYGFSGSNARFVTAAGNPTNDFVKVNFKWAGSKASGETIRYIRYDFNFGIGQMSSVPCPTTPGGNVPGEENVGYEDETACIAAMSGTSMAAPTVTGIVALLQQENIKRQKREGKLDIDGNVQILAMRNSTIKGVLIHTAEDMMSDRDAFLHNADVTGAHNNGNKFGPEVHYTTYGKGPDFATGWGEVNAKKALEVVANGKFKEIEIKDKMEKRWNIKVTDASNGHLRTTLTWDDAPATVDNSFRNGNYLKRKLVNDLDMYLVSPSGRMYYPWRLAPLPTKYVSTPVEDKEDETPEERTKRQAEADANRESGLEAIHEGDVQDAVNTCSDNDKLSKNCFDHLNNVEVVDVENPELGVWQVVVRGNAVLYGNNEDGDAQIASLVSDFIIQDQVGGCEVTHPYVPNQRIACEYNLGSNLKSYVTFANVFSEAVNPNYVGPKTYLGDGDVIRLYADNKLIGTYHNNELSGKTIPVSGKKLKVVLNSDKDSSVGWGFKVQKIRSIPLTIVPLILGR